VGAVDEMECEAWMIAQSRHLNINGSEEGTTWRCSRPFIAGTPITSSRQGPETLFWRTLEVLASRQALLS